MQGAHAVQQAPGICHGTAAPEVTREFVAAPARHVHIDKGQIVVIDGHHVRGDRRRRCDVGLDA